MVKQYRKKRAKAKPSTLRAVGNTALRALHVANQVRQLLNVEYKVYDTYNTGTNISDDGFIFQVCNPGQGDGSSQRDGDSVKIKRLVIRGTINCDADQPLGSTVRLMVIKTENEYLPTGSGGTALQDVFAGRDTSGNAIQTIGSGIAIFSPKFYENRKNYRILWEKVIQTDDAYASRRPFKVNLKLNHDILFALGSTTPTSGGLALVAISDSDAAGTDFPAIVYYSRAYFLDN